MSVFNPILSVAVPVVLAMAAMPQENLKGNKEQPLGPREKILRVANQEVGVQEKTGNNDGEPDKYLQAVGLGGSRAPYCAAFVTWVGVEALGNENPYPNSAWSPVFVRSGTRVTKKTQVEGAEAFGIWFRSKGRIAHTGIVDSREGDHFITVEGNTSSNSAVGSAADREGQGVYKKRRHYRTVHSVRDWVANPSG